MTGATRNSPAAPPGASTVPRLPVVTLYLTDRCNSRCVTCDYWRTGRENLTLAALERLLPSLEELGTRVAVLSGGEPLLNPEWRAIAAALASRGIDQWLLTSGLSLVKHARPVAAVFQRLTVSLDGTQRETYRAIRGLDAFDAVTAGIRAVTEAGLAPGLRVTLQRTNYRELPRFVRLARELGARDVSFLAVDVSNPHAFGRDSGFPAGLALGPDDLDEFAALIDGLERDFAAEFAGGFIVESPARLRKLHAYFAALLGKGEFPAVRCNAPEFSAVIGLHGEVSPCFFIPGPASVGARELARALDAHEMRELRADIRAGRRAECARCVCSLWRDPQGIAALGRPAPLRGHA
jgi:MoaA/NifB/PqqE/SkfB family radical SAM enzyme